MYLFLTIILFLLLGQEKALNIAESFINIFGSAHLLLFAFFLIGLFIVIIFELSFIREFLTNRILGFKFVSSQQGSTLGEKLSHRSSILDDTEVEHDIEFLIDNKCELPISMFARSGKIILTPSLINLPEDQLNAVIAHCKYHIHKNHNILNRIFIICAYPWHILSIFYEISFLMLKKMGFFEQRGIALLFIWPYYFVHVLLYVIRFIYLRLRRWIIFEDEMEADRYVVRIGLQDALEKYFRRLAETEKPETGYWSWYFKLHPPIKDRMALLKSLYL